MFLMVGINNMHNKKHPGIAILNILIFFCALLFYYTGILPISIKGIAPLLVLPILTAFSIYHSPLACAFTGLACGIFMDSCALGSFCFNAIMLLLIGTFVSLAASNLFNKNIFSASVLSLIVCAVYFVLLWLVFHMGNNMNDSMIYLLNYAFPSAVYSAVFIIPFYYLFRHFNKRLSE